MVATAQQWQAENARQTANDNAMAAYQQGMLELGNKQLAFQKAQQVWKETMDRSGLTGQYEGQWTMPTQQWFAENFGTWGTPQQGQQTMAREAQTFGQGATTAELYGAAYGPEGPAAGTKTLAGQQQEWQQGFNEAELYGQGAGGRQTLAGAEQGFTQGLRTQQEQRAAQAQQQEQTQAYLNLLSNLRGPADWAKYQQVLGSTPQGMRDLAAAAMGQYVPGGGATTGVQPQAVSLQSLMGDVSGNPYTGQGGGQLGQPNVYGQNTAGVYQQGTPGAQPQQWQNQYQPQMEQMQAAQQQYQQQMAQQGQYDQRYQPYAQTIQNMVTQPGQQQPQENATYQALQASYNPAVRQQLQQQQAQVQQQYAQQQPQNNQAINALGNGTNIMGAQQQAQQPQRMNLPAPNQIAAQSWNNLTPSQKDMMMGEYEAQGWYKPDVEALRNQALPKYASNSPRAGTWRMQ